MNLQVFGKLQMPPLLARIDWVFPCARCLPHTIILKISRQQLQGDIFSFIYILQVRTWAQREVICSMSHSDSRDSNQGLSFFFFPSHVACGIPVPCALGNESAIITTGTPGNSPWMVLCKKIRSWSLKALTQDKHLSSLLRKDTGCF